MKKIKKTLTIFGISALGLGAIIPFSINSMMINQEAVKESPININSPDYDPNVWVVEEKTFDTQYADDNGLDLSQDIATQNTTTPISTIKWDTDFLQMDEDFTEVTIDRITYNTFKDEWDEKDQDIRADDGMIISGSDIGEYRQVVVSSPEGSEAELNVKYNDTNYSITNEEAQISSTFTFNATEVGGENVNSDETEGKIARIDLGEVRVKGLVDEYNIDLLDTSAWGEGLDEKLNMPIFTKNANLVTFQDLSDALYQILPEFGGIPTDFTEIVYWDNANEDFISKDTPVTFKIRADGTNENVYGETDWIIFNPPIIEGEFSFDKNNPWYQVEDSSWIYSEEKSRWIMQTNDISSMKINDSTVEGLYVNGQLAPGGLGGDWEEVIFGEETETSTKESKIVKIDFFSGETIEFEVQTLLKPKGVKYDANEGVWTTLDRELSTLSLNEQLQVVNGFIATGDAYISLLPEDIINYGISEIDIDKRSGNEWIDFDIINGYESELVSEIISDTGLYRVNTKDIFGNSYIEYLEKTDDDGLSQHLSKVEESENWPQFVMESSEKGITESELIAFDNLEFIKHSEFMNSLKDINNITISNEEINSFLSEEGVRIYQNKTKVSEIEYLIEQYVFDHTELSRGDLEFNFQSNSFAQEFTLVQVDSTHAGHAIGTFEFVMQIFPNVFDINDQEINIQIIKDHITENEFRVIDGQTRIEEAIPLIEESIASQLNISVSEINVSAASNEFMNNTSDINVEVPEGNDTYHGMTSFEFQMDSNVKNLELIEFNGLDFSEFVKASGTQIVMDVTEIKDIEDILIEFVEERTGVSNRNFSLEMNLEEKVTNDSTVLIKAKEDSILYGEKEITFKLDPTVEWVNGIFREQESKMLIYEDNKGNQIVQVEYLIDDSQRNISDKSDAIVVQGNDSSVYMDSQTNEILLADSGGQLLVDYDTKILKFRSPSGVITEYDWVNGGVISNNDKLTDLIVLIVLATTAFILLLLIRELLSRRHSKKMFKLKSS